MRVCIPIVVDTNAEAMEKMRCRFPAPGFSEVILELRADRIRDLDLAALLAERRGRVLVTNRKGEEGGGFSGNEEERVRVLMDAVSLGADGVDIEATTDRDLILELKSEIESRSRTGSRAMLIVSSHDFRKTPSAPRLRERLALCAAWNPDIVKIVTTAQSAEDNLKILGLIPYARTKGLEIIAFCMGRLGRISRVASPMMGAYLGFAAASKREASGPGQMTVKEMTRISEILSGKDTEA